MNAKKSAGKLINRRMFLETAGKVGIEAAILTLPVINSCKGGNPSGPDSKPVQVNLNFKVYNHTQGLRAEFSQINVMTGTKRDFSVADLVSKYNISNVDVKRIAIRSADSNSLVQYSSQGSAGIVVNDTDTNYEIYLFNSAGSVLYESGENRQYPLRLVLHTNIPVYRRDLGGFTGEEGIWGGKYLSEINGGGVFDQYNEVLHPSWASLRYGYFDRQPSATGGTFSYGFADCSQDYPAAVEGDGYAMGFFEQKSGIIVDPVRVPDVRGQVERGLGVVLELIVGQVPDVFGQPSYKSISSEGVLNQAGKDLIAYLFVKGI